LAIYCSIAHLFDIGDHHLNSVDITADVSSFSFSDGSGFVITNADTTFSDQFVISTDSSGDITVWSLNVCTTPT
jgi:hypothetical protein